MPCSAGAVLSYSKGLFRRYDVCLPMPHATSVARAVRDFSMTRAARATEVACNKVRGIEQRETEVLYRKYL